MIKLGQRRCSFCGKSETEVLKLVAGPRVYICDRCVAMASQIMDHPPDDNPPPRFQAPVWRKLLTRARRFLRSARRLHNHSVQPTAGRFAVSGG